MAVHDGDYVTVGGENLSKLHITGNLWLNKGPFTLDDFAVDGSVLINQRPGGNYNNPPNVISGVKLTHGQAADVGSVGCDGIEIGWFKTTGGSTTLAMLYGNTVPFAHANIHDSVFAGIEPTKAGAHLEAEHPYGATNCQFTNVVYDATTTDPTTFADITACLTCEAYNGISGPLSFTNVHLFGGGAYQLYPNASGSSWTGLHMHSYVDPSGKTHTPKVYGQSAMRASGTRFLCADVVTSGCTIDGAPVDLRALILA